MSNPYSLREDGIADEYGYRHQLVEEIARGGQGIVFRTSDPDIAVKQPLNSEDVVSASSKLRTQIRNVRCLPVPRGLPISFPVAVLRDEPGYVMRLLNEMEPFSAFEFNGKARLGLANLEIPEWLSKVDDRNIANALMHYSISGSTKRRLGVLSILASILARLHAAGLVYCDVSPNNCFMSEADHRNVWLIDADNLRFELQSGGSAVYTPRYGAPEIVQGLDQSRPRTDAWAFAVMAFEIITLIHPFVGQQVLQSSEDVEDWDVESNTESSANDPHDQAYAGSLPYVDDKEDDSNRSSGGLPRSIVFTTNLDGLFHETFSDGREQAWRRPSLNFWALELARAHDESLVCPTCSMSYYFGNMACPYCGLPRPKAVVFSTRHWRLVQQVGCNQVDLPHRLFNEFSLEMHASSVFEVELDFDKQMATHTQGSDPLPENLAITFVEQGR
jgi:serine/threonine protein kinase